MLHNSPIFGIQFHLGEAGTSLSLLPFHRADSLVKSINGGVRIVGNFALGVLFAVGDQSIKVSLCLRLLQVDLCGDSDCLGVSEGILILIPHFVQGEGRILLGPHLTTFHKCFFYPRQQEKLTFTELKSLYVVVNVLRVFVSCDGLLGFHYSVRLQVLDEPISVVVELASII